MGPIEGVLSQGIAPTAWIGQGQVHELSGPLRRDGAIEPRSLIMRILHRQVERHQGSARTEAQATHSFDAQQLVGARHTAAGLLKGPLQSLAAGSAATAGITTAHGDHQTCPFRTTASRRSARAS